MKKILSAAILFFVFVGSEAFAKYDLSDIPDKWESEEEKGTESKFDPTQPFEIIEVGELNSKPFDPDEWLEKRRGQSQSVTTGAQPSNTKTFFNATPQKRPPPNVLSWKEILVYIAILLFAIFAALLAYWSVWVRLNTKDKVKKFSVEKRAFFAFSFFWWAYVTVRTMDDLYLFGGSYDQWDKNYYSENLLLPVFVVFIAYKALLWIKSGHSK